MDKRKIFSDLLKDKGINGDWEKFFAVGEGSFSPDGLEDESGYIITYDGRLFSYYFEWTGRAYSLGNDNVCIEYIMGTENGDEVWRSVEEDQEFIEAKRKLESRAGKGR